MRLPTAFRRYLDERKSQRHLRYLRENTWEDLIPGSVIRYTGPPLDSKRHKIAHYEGLTLMLKGVSGGENPEPCFIPVRLDPPQLYYDPTTNYFLTPPGDTSRHIGMLPLFYEGGDPMKQGGINFLSAKREDFEVVGFATPAKWDKKVKELREELAGTK